MQISHETIYKSLYLQARGVLKKELMKQLRYGHKIRHTKLHSTRGDRGAIRIVNGLSLSDRPPEVSARAVPGHWEGDLISGSNNSHIATLVECNSRYTMLAQLDGKDTDSVVQAITREMIKLPLNLKKHWHGTEVWKWLNMRALPLQLTWRFISATHRVLGSVVPTKIPIVCLGNTSLRKRH